MPINIRDFNVAMSRTGLLRDNRFEVAIPRPAGLLGIPGMQRVAQDTVISCEAAVLPGMKVHEDNVRRYGYGPIEKKPVGAVFTDAEFIFRCGDDGAIYDFLHSWQQICVNYDQRDGIETATIPGQWPGELAYKADYAVDITITAYSQIGAPATITVLRDAWPIFVADVSVAWAAKGGYVRVPATFTYFDWYRLPSVFGAV